FDTQRYALRFEHRAEQFDIEPPRIAVFIEVLEWRVVPVAPDDERLRWAGCGRDAGAGDRERRDDDGQREQDRARETSWTCSIPCRPSIHSLPPGEPWPPSSYPATRSV